MSAASDGPKELPDPPPVLPREAVQRWRLVLARRPIAPDVAQREQLAAWESALVASGLPLAGLDGDRPRPRFATAAPLAAGIPGEAELVDIWLVERLPAWRVREALAGATPAGWGLVEAYDVWLGEPALPGRVVASVYRATLAPGTVEPDALRAAAAGLIAAASLPRERRKGEGVVAYDLRPFLDAIDVDDGGVVRLTLLHDPEKGVGRPEEALAALAERVGRALPAAEIVRERLVLGEPPPAGGPGPRPRAARRGRSGR